MPDPGSAPEAGRRMRKAKAVLVAAAVLVGLVAGLVACGRSPAGEAAGTERIAHVHGLGVNPADGEVYVATHHGLFRLGDGDAERVSDHAHDFMGFTVAGPDHFQASGHPSPASGVLQRRGRRPLLGLVESTDGGRTWASTSLLGEADFHAMTAAHGRVYGYDAASGRFMVSADGVVWDVRSVRPLADFAVDPADADHVVAATGEGFAVSVDGGRSWRAEDGPAVALLGWSTRYGLWAVTADAAVHEHLDGGWIQRSRLPGRPEALLVHDQGLFAATDDGTSAVLRSSDGRTWETVFEDGSAA